MFKWYNQYLNGKAPKDKYICKEIDGSGASTPTVMLERAGQTRVSDYGKWESEAGSKLEYLLM